MAFVKQQGIHLAADYLPRSEPTSIHEKAELLTQCSKLCYLHEDQSCPEMVVSEYILWMKSRPVHFVAKNSTKNPFVQSFTFMLHDVDSPDLTQMSSSRVKLSCWLKWISTYRYLTNRSLAIIRLNAGCLPAQQFLLTK